MGDGNTMTKEFWTIKEVIEVFELEEITVEQLEEEEILCPRCQGDLSSRLFSREDMERLRLAKILMDEMGVNIPGVDIILRLRQNLIDMRRQFDAILEDVANHVRKGDLKRE